MKLLLVTIVASFTFTACADEIWIGWGTPGGSGTMASPKMVNTADDFDTEVNAQPVASKIHLLAGTFLTQSGIQLKRGTSLSGAGIDVTTVKLDDSATMPCAPCAVIRDYDPDQFTSNVGGSEVLDLTVDCNLQGQTTTSPHAHGAVGLRGGQTRIARVKAINWGTTSPDANVWECFVITIWNHLNNGAATNCLIEECIVTQPAPVIHNRETSAIDILGQCYDRITPGPGWIWNAEIRNCSVYSVQTGSGDGQPTQFHGYGIGGVVGAKIANNFANQLLGSSVAVYNEGGSQVGYTIQDNVFLDVSGGIRMFPVNTPDNCTSGEYRRENYVIRGNMISLGQQDNPNPVDGIQVYGTPAAHVKNAVIENNFITEGPTFLSGNGHGIYAALTDGLTITANRIDLPTCAAALDIVSSTLNGAKLSDNTTTAGASLNSTDNGLQQDSQLVQFIPGSTAGWYRMCSAPNYSSGTLRISAAEQNTVTDLEFDYAIPAHTPSSDAIQVNVKRSLSFGSIVPQIRAGTDGAGGAFLDLYFSPQFPANPPVVTVEVIGRQTLPFLKAPQPNPTPPPYVRTVAVGSGFRVSGSLFAGSSQMQITDVSGHIVSAALGTGTASSSTFLRGDQTWAPVPNVVMKTADESRTSTTLTDDGVLKFQMAASTKYTIRLKVFFSTANTPDFKYRIIGPASALVRRHITRAVGGAAPTAVAVGTAYDASIGVVLDGTGAEGVIEEEIIVHNTSQGDFTFKWAQKMSGSATTVRAGSYLQYMPF